MRASVPTIALLVAGATLLLAACETSEEHVYDASDGDARAAVADLEGRSGSSLTGRARFTETQGGLLAEVWVENAPPGPHAVHLHEHGDCSAPDATSAGAHWNPTTESHGGPFHAQHHAGDLGNMTVRPDGTGYHAVFLPRLSVGGELSVIGRALVVHAEADDLQSQPSGAAGGRIGCGVVRAQR